MIMDFCLFYLMDEATICFVCYTSDNKLDESISDILSQLNEAILCVFWIIDVYHHYYLAT